MIINLTPLIDLYDTPIDLRPLPKETRTSIINECIELLRAHGDYYGVRLLEGAQNGTTESPQ